jgi:hypothetical protein
MALATRSHSPSLQERARPPAQHRRKGRRRRARARPRRRHHRPPAAEGHGVLAAGDPRSGSCRNGPIMGAATPAEGPPDGRLPSGSSACGSSHWQIPGHRRASAGSQRSRPRLGQPGPGQGNIGLQGRAYFPPAAAVPCSGTTTKPGCRSTQAAAGVSAGPPSPVRHCVQIYGT